MCPESDELGEIENYGPTMFEHSQSIVLFFDQLYIFALTTVYCKKKSDQG